MLSQAVHAVAIARTPFHGKFGIPRQAGLVNVPATIELLEPYNHPDAVEGLGLVSHLWLTFLFSENLEDAPRLKVRPPRLGGNQKVGVFATRSSFRPNSLGQSLVRLDGIECDSRGVRLRVSGIDLLDGTPIVDIKPYLPYADSPQMAFNHLAPEAPDPQALQVQWLEPALQQLGKLSVGDEVKAWITELLALDPRPAYAGEQPGNSERVYGMSVFGLNVRWLCPSATEARVISIEALAD